MRMPRSTSARYALSPQLTSWRCTPEITPVVQLKMREKSRRGNGSFRRVFQPETRSNPSSSFARSFGISAGSSWRSASIVTTTSPRASRKPGLQRRGLPEVAPQVDDHDVRHLVVQPREDRHARVGRSVVDEHDLELVRHRLECGRDLGVQRLERVLLVEQGYDDRDHDKEGIGPPGRLLQPSSGSGSRTGRPRSARIPTNAPPASVVGTNQLACMRIEYASACSTGTSRSPSAATPIHWYVPM